ncbi:MAG: ABC transporter permease [Thermoanaerobaculia bacterium]
MSLQDLRHAVQSLRRSPGFLSIAVITLGLGIGANTAMFSILNGYFLQPPPYPESDRLDRIYRVTAQNPRGGISPADWLELKPAMRGYGDIAAYAAAEMSLSETGRPAEVTETVRTSTTLFSILGVQPRLGRDFEAREEVRGSHHVLILSHRYWQDRFGGDPNVIGRSVRLDGEAHEIIGVLPAGFSDWRHLSWVDAFVPFAPTPEESRDRNATWVRLVGRRAEGLTPAEGNGFIAGFGRRLAAEFPTANAGTSWRAEPIDETWMPADASTILIMLIGLSGFVLLIACSNLANLLLARTMARAREFAVRSALGASRARLLRPLLLENLVLALAGGVCAIFVALWAFEWLSVASAGDSGVGVELALDWRVLSWAFGVCLFTAVAFGAAPALFLSRLDPNRNLKSGSRGATGDRGQQRLRNALVVGQFALAMVLLAGAGLFMRGLHELNNRRAGWESDGLVTGTVVLPNTTYTDDPRIAEFHTRALERLEALPGVASASFSYAMPYFGLAEPRKYVVEGEDAPEPGKEPTAVINGVTPHYFETVGTRLREGRTFTDYDDAGAPKVFIINEAMARGLFREENAIGRRLAEAGGEALEWGTVVGVVANVEAVESDFLTPPWQLYQPMAQEPRAAGELAVRVAGVPPPLLVDRIRTAIATLDPDLPVRKLQPAEVTIRRANYQLGVLRTMLTSLALLGLALAALGVYGVIARSMAERKREFGIRLALGAMARDITRLVLSSGAKLALLGSGIGLAGAFALTRFLAAAFPGMRAESLPVIAGAMLVLVVIAQIASYLPARNAARINPAETLQGE